ncbi:MAG: gliding motility-associated C-terminal domain-containing protein [Chlorobi bacterium]|nr:gliding motility-associated C-terminal domain-containing protein [Chlorobiota bacterium]
MYIRTLLFIISLLLTTSMFAQNRANIWYFGNEAGIDFSNGEPVPVFNGKIHAESGCASICDTIGQLLFYTNGKNVWDAEHNVMPNGDSLIGSSLANQNTVIIPNPANNDLYYLFTVDSLSNGLSYSEIDMTLNNHLGDITTKNQILTGFVNGKITAVKHCNSKYSWVIIRKADTPLFNSYLVSDTGGVSQDPVTSLTGSGILADIGYLKASPPGDKIALPINSTEILLEIFDFDNSTGTISNPKRIYKNDDIIYAYGVEFSGDGKFLYIATGGQKYDLLQFDLMKGTEEEINGSAVKISSGNIYALQIGPDSKIYGARVNDNSLSVINYPERKGEDCFFEKAKIDLGDKECLMGLPGFNQSYFYFPSISHKNTCLGETTSMWFNGSTNIDSAVWEIPNIDLDTNIYEYPFTLEHTFEVAENFSINVFAYHCGAVDTIYGDITITQNPKINLGNDTTIQEGNTITLDAGEGMDEYLWNTGDDGQELIVWDTGIYWSQVTKSNCFAIDTIRVSMIPASIQLPNAFSPNGDGLNDFFEPILNGLVTDYRIEIYNRFGEMVWQSSDILNGWDGNYKGEPCPVEMYVWQMRYKIIKGEKSEVYKDTGNVSLFR